MNKLGRYDIIRVLGKGAMGLVYEARDPNLDRRVAIKTIKVENLSEEAAAEYEARFRIEARSAGRLQHPNIVSVYDSDRHGDIAYLVMEFVQGEDLKQHLDGGALYSLEQSLSMVLDLLSALDYAHRQNVVHRDVKPANLLVEASGRVKLTDFGVARIQDSGDATRTRGSMVGTLKYMSPEQVQGQPIDARSDLFAVGVVLYQLLTGKRPFDGDTDFAIIQQVVSGTPPAPSSFNAQLPPALDAVVARALAKQRDDRYATAHEFALALEEATGQLADRSMVPPLVSPVGGAGGTGSQRSRSFGTPARQGTLSDGSGSTMTQELELVYWKDVRDSADSEDLVGFLQRFPSGIYADLARRRLKKLAQSGTQGGDNEATQMDVTTVATSLTHVVPPPEVLAEPAPAVSEAGLDAAPQPDAEAQEPPAPQAAPVSEPAPVPGPVVEPPAPPTVEAAAPQEPEPLAEPVAMAAPQTTAPAATEPAPPRSSGKPVLALAGVVVLVLAGLGYAWMSGGSTPEPAAPVSSAPALAPAPAVSDAAGPPASAAVAGVAAPVGAGSAAAAPVASAASRPASRPAATAIAPRAPLAAKAAASKPAVPEVAAPVPAPQPAARPAASRGNAEPAQEPAAAVPAPAVANPTQACEGRVLLGYQSCMNEQCAKPAFTGHAVCVERRAAERLRRDSQTNTRN